MTRPLFVLHDPPRDGPTNMARDEALLHSPAIAPAALRLYAWSPPTISLGYFQRFADVAALPADVRDLPVVRRQTGGGAILHDCEVTYCLVVDDSLPVARQAPDALYRLAHEAWRAALAATGRPVDVAPDSFPMPSPRSGPFFCFEKPGRTDLIVDGLKLVGSAQRRIPRVATAAGAPPAPAAGRVLQHGSLLLAQRFASHPGCDLGAPDPATVAGWTTDFVARVAAALDLTPTRLTWTDELAAAAAEFRERYAGAAWTELR